MRDTATRIVLIAAILLSLATPAFAILAQPAAAQSQTQQSCQDLVQPASSVSGADANTTTTNTTARSDYTVIEGGCSVTLRDGQVLQNILIRANGQPVSIRGRGSWTIRNVAVLDAGESSPSGIFNLQTSRNGRGVMTNIFTNRSNDNVIFVGRGHAGEIYIQNSTFLATSRDVAYASSPGNPGEPVKPLGSGGEVHFRGIYVRGVGLNDPAYGLRLGSDGSTISDSTVDCAGGGPVGVANLFAGGELGGQRPDAPDGTVMRNVSIQNCDIGVRLNPHQDPRIETMPWPTVTQLEDVRVSDAEEPIQSNVVDAGGPVVNGRELGSGPTLSAIGGVSVSGAGGGFGPPSEAPQSAQRAASGVGGGVGGIAVPGGADGGELGSGSSGPGTGIGPNVGRTIFAIFIGGTLAVGIAFVVLTFGTIGLLW